MQQRLYRLNMQISFASCLRPGEHPLQVHPAALPAFDVLSSLGCVGAAGSVGRAVQEADNALLVFSGFGVFALPPSERYLLVEDKLPPEVILRAAWQDVADVLGLLRVPVPNRRTFAQAVAQRAPADRLAEWGLPPDRAPTKLLQQIRANRTDGDDHRQPTIFQSVLRRLKGDDM